MATITNTGKGPRGVWSGTKLVMIAPGETRDVQNVTGRISGDLRVAKPAAKAAKPDEKSGDK